MSRRIRTIKPEILDDDKTASLSHVAWRLFVSGLTLSDDHGNLRAGATYLLGQVFHSCPATDTETIHRAVDELVEAALWQVYTVRGQTYAHIRGWSKHQRIDNAGKPKVPTPAESDGTQPTSDAAKNKVRGESRRFAAVRGESPRVAAVRGGSRLEVERETEVDQDQDRESAGASARPLTHAHVCEDAPATSPSARVLATVVSEVPPSRTPPAPVEVAPSLPTAPSAPPSAATGASSAPDAEDDDQPPPAQRVPSTPRPEPVAVAAPAPAPAPVAPPAAARPSAPVAVAPTLPLDLPAEDDAPSAMRRVSELSEHTPANRVLRAWGRACYDARHQPLATDARRRAVLACLRVFPEADLVRALDAAMRDPYVNGTSDRAPSGGQRDIAWLFAKVERVERWLQQATPAPAPTPAAPAAAAPRPIRLPPPPKPGEVRPTLTREEFERSALAAFQPRRTTVAEVNAALGLEVHHAS